MSNAVKIQQLREEIAKLEEQDKIFNAMSDEEKLAVTLHSKLCHFDHTDQCGWGYEMSGGRHQWSGSTHASWLKKATKMMHQCRAHDISADVAIKIITIANEL